MNMLAVSRDQMISGLFGLPIAAFAIAPVMYENSHEGLARPIAAATLFMSLTLLVARVVLNLNVVLAELEQGKVFICEFVGGAVVGVAIFAAWLTFCIGSVFADLVVSAGILALSGVVSGLARKYGGRPSYYHLRSLIVDEAIGFAIIIWAVLASLYADLTIRETFATAVMGGSAIRCYAAFVAETLRSPPWK